MKAKLIVTDDDGQVYEAELELVAAGTRRKVKKQPRDDGEPTATAAKNADFSLPLRAFMSRYARGRTGSQAFALLVARLADGKPNTEVTADAIQTEWNRMKGLIGAGYAAVHATRAKNKAWVDSPRRGVFVALDWAGALQGGRA